MAAILAASGFALMGVGLIYEASKGLRGIPDRRGKVTSKGTAWATGIIGILLIAAGAAMPFVISD